MRLLNKVALITGSAQGIGKAIAELFVKEGATVIFSDINDVKGRGACHDINIKRQQWSESNPAEYMHLDVSSESDWQKAEQYIQQCYHGLDIIVNNAGITGFLETTGAHDPEYLDMASWHKVHQVNLDGVALGCKTAIALMKNRPTDENRKSSIINISSRSGLVGIPLAAAYASSKAGVRNHSKSVALYCAQNGYDIRCNSIHPAAIYTPMWDAMLGEGNEREDAIKAISKDIPLGYMGDVMDVAYAALYLASDESKYVTGTELTIDGGILAGSTATPNS
ncbi:SDR family oxidoreductase [Psychrobacter immobilis]|uniref:SDR family oxidoreductase n=1 Tax=Psychrobacter immobilis TaxID=498 RepID=UPI00191A4653|nr:SDR family oxidoreductase [Psychrobacter immobilis]